MGSYVESNLLKNENVQYEAEISVWPLLPKFLLGLLLIILSLVIIGEGTSGFILLPFYGGGLLLWVSVAIRYFTTELVMTNKRVIAKFGFISRYTIEMNISKVESIQVDQNLFGRILNFGSILIAGAGDPKTPIPGISYPLKFRKTFFEVQEGATQLENP